MLLRRKEEGVYLHFSQYYRFGWVYMRVDDNICKTSNKNVKID